ncbi:MAG: hypothetical protein IKS11_07880 [Lachnospiraceae bacterium]|nr:hypothetical protein [Lachnospiraceae bacterium]
MATRKKKGKKKGNQQEGLKFAIVVLSALILLLVIYLIQRVQKENRATPTDAPTPTTMVLNTGTPAPTSGTPVKDTPTAIPTETPTPPAFVTEAPTPEPTGMVAVPTQDIPLTGVPVGTQAVTPTPATTAGISHDEALALIEKNIDKSLYSASLTNDDLNIDGSDLYLFTIYDKTTGKAFPSFLAVSRQTGKLYYYDSLTLSEFDKFPPDTAAAVDPEKQPVTGGITAKQAYELLCTMNKDDLFLAKGPADYQAEYSDVITNEINGKDCYSIQLFETSNGKKRLRGEFFISTDGLDCYYNDSDTGEFVLVPIG